MFKGKVLSIDEMLKKSEEVKKADNAPNAPKLTKDESREWINIRIRNRARNACRYPDRNKVPTLDSVTNEIYEGLVEDWAYNKQVLDACRAIKLNREYIRMLVSDLFDNEGKAIVPKGVEEKVAVEAIPIRASMVSIDEAYEELDKGPRTATKEQFAVKREVRSLKKAEKCPKSNPGYKTHHIRYKKGGKVGSVDVKAEDRAHAKRIAKEKHGIEDEHILRMHERE